MLLRHSERSLTINNSKLVKVVWPIAAIGAGVGLVLSWTLLSGDALGRVNLLYLLLIFLAVPILTIIVSLSSLIFGDGFNSARLVSSIPIWGNEFKALIRKMHQLNLDRLWFLMQSQVAAIGFSIASLLAFLILLLVTDINFVWRSTVLEATDILPLLEVIARPWWFWEAAQPSLALLQMTQESRLQATHFSVSVYGGWWQYILATQLIYSILLRGLVLVICRLLLVNKLGADFEAKLSEQYAQQSINNNAQTYYASSVDSLPKDLAINNWGNIPQTLINQLPQINYQQDRLLTAGPSATAAQHAIAERWRAPQLVIVKAWEPPLAELTDFLQNGTGYILPLDWHQSADGSVKLITPNQNHLDEWRRITAKLPQWQLYLPAEWP